MKEDDVAQNQQLPSASGQEEASARQPISAGPVAPSSGHRPALRELRRELSDQDLASPGVQKLLLEELERADLECAELKSYRDRFYERDRTAAILQERLKPATALEIFFGVGIGLGGAIVGLAPVFWSDGSKGQLCLFIGFAMIAGSTIGRIAKR